MGSQDPPAQLELPWWACEACGEDLAICQCETARPPWMEGWDASAVTAVWKHRFVEKPIENVISELF